MLIKRIIVMDQQLQNYEIKVDVFKQIFSTWLKKNQPVVLLGACVCGFLIGWKKIALQHATKKLLKQFKKIIPWVFSQGLQTIIKHSDWYK